MVWNHCHSCDIEIFELLELGALSLSTTAVIQLFHIGREYGLRTGRLQSGDAHAFRPAWSIDGVSKCPIALGFSSAWMTRF